jgi:hypothetical protein
MQEEIKTYWTEVVYSFEKSIIECLVIFVDIQKYFIFEWKMWHSGQDKQRYEPESIELFIEDEAFWLSFVLAPPPPLHTPLLPANYLSFWVFLCVAGRAYWRKREDGGGAKS